MLRRSTTGRTSSSPRLPPRRMARSPWPSTTAGSRVPSAIRTSCPPTRARRISASIPPFNSLAAAPTDCRNSVRTFVSPRPPGTRRIPEPIPMGSLIRAGQTARSRSSVTISGSHFRIKTRLFLLFPHTTWARMPRTISNSSSELFLFRLIDALRSRTDQRFTGGEHGNPADQYGSDGFSSNGGDVLIHASYASANSPQCHPRCQARCFAAAPKSHSDTGSDRGRPAAGSGAAPDPPAYCKFSAGSVRPAAHRSTVGREYGDRKSTRLNSSHDQISYAVFCLKKKKKSIDDCLLISHLAKIR